MAMSKDKKILFSESFLSETLRLLSRRVFIKPKAEPMNRDIDILSKTIFGEARGESKEGQRAIGLVVLNRYRSNKWFSGTTIADTCLKYKQFSCWNRDDPNYKKLLEVSGDKITSFITLATDLVNGKCADITNGATHYHTKQIMPKWAKGKLPCAEIGNHIFYKNID